VTAAGFVTTWKGADMQCSQELPKNQNKATAQLYAHELTIGNATVSFLSFSCFFGLVIFLYILANIYLVILQMLFLNNKYLV